MIYVYEYIKEEVIVLFRVKVLTKVVTTVTLVSALACVVEGVESYAMLRKATPIVKQVQKGTKLLLNTRPYHMKRESDNNRDSLLRAVKEKNIAAVSQILESDPTMDINEFTDHRGFSPFWISLRNDDLPMVTKLARAGADVSENSPKSMDEVTPLNYAIKMGNTPLVKLLLKNGALKDEKTKALELSDAIYRHRDIKMIQLLVDAIDSKDVCSNALVTAIGEKYIEAVKALVEAGADVNHPGTPGSAWESPLGYAIFEHEMAYTSREKNSYQEIEEYLQSAGANPFTKEEIEAIQKKAREHREYNEKQRMYLESCLANANYGY